MSKICKKRVHRNDKKKFTMTPEKVSWVAPFYTTDLALVHKKGDKKCLKNYGNISLLCLCNIIFEFLIYKIMFTYLICPNNHDLDFVTFAFISYLLLFMKLISCLMMGSKQGYFSRIYQKLFIRLTS